MGLPLTREELRIWCLGKLGEPVIKVNVAYEQQQNRIDEALERFREHHFDGVERYYLKRQITASVFKFASAIGFQFERGHEVTGVTSGAKAEVWAQASNNLTLEFTTKSGTFQIGEDITGTAGTATLSSSSDAITLGDKDNEYIPCDDSIIAVVSVVPTGGLLGQGLFSTNYQLAVQSIPNFSSGDLSNYFMQRQHLALIEELFTGDKIVAFNRMQNKINITLNWKTGIAVGDYMIIDCYKALNPETYKKIYSNWFVREYTTALIKQQWGENLTKYNNITMPGGVTLNGEKILNDAVARLSELEEKLRNEFQLPPMFFVG